jgi:hypothetical protein
MNGPVHAAYVNDQTHDPEPSQRNANMPGFDRHPSDMDLAW